MRRTLILALAVVVACVFVSSAVATMRITKRPGRTAHGVTASVTIVVSPKANPPTIVPWNKVGGFGIGMTRSAVEYTYGRSSNGFYRVPAGWVNIVITGGSYRGLVPLGGRVTLIRTNSPYYKTADGLASGHPSHEASAIQSVGGCRFLWRGFLHHPAQVGGGGFWTKYTRYGAQKSRGASPRRPRTHQGDPTHSDRFQP